MLSEQFQTVNTTQLCQFRTQAQPSGPIEYQQAGLEDCANVVMFLEASQSVSTSSGVSV